jgi:ABC-type transport system substrate-binding protein
MRLLAAAGFTAQNPLRFEISGNDSTTAKAQAELHQSQINRLSRGAVQVTGLRLPTVAQSNSLLAQGDFDVFSSNVVPAQPYDVDSWFTTIYLTNGGRSSGKLSDPTLDQMIDKQRTIFDRVQRKAYVKDMFLYMMDNIPYTSWSGRYILNVGHRKVKGWAPEGSSAVWGYNFENMWLDV